MNQGSGSALSDATGQLPDASKVPSYVNLARCVSGYTSLTSYTSPARREYSPARRDFSPIGGRSRRDFSPAPSHLSGSGLPTREFSGVPNTCREVSCSRLDNFRLLDNNKENPAGAGMMISRGGGPISPQKYTVQGQPCDGASGVIEEGRPYLRLSMLDNYNNSTSNSTRTSRTTFRSPLHLPKSPPSPGSNGMPSVIDMNRLPKNGVENRSPAKNAALNGGSPYYATNGDILNRNSAAERGGSSSPDAVDSDIRRRVEQLEKASCKNLSYNINRTSKSPKVDETKGRNGSPRQYPIRNYSSAARDDFSEKEIITLDGSEKGSPIPVMKLLNPEFRAMLGKTTKISPNKQFTTDFSPTGLSPLAKGKNDVANNNEDSFAGTNGSKNINLKNILTAKGSVNGGTTVGETGPNKLVNINVIVNKNVKNLIKRDLSDDEVELNNETRDEVLNCRNNNVQRHRELIENNINSSFNVASSEMESSVQRIRNDLENSSSTNGDGNKDVLVKLINTPVSNIKGNLVRSELERLDRTKLDVSVVNSKEIAPEVIPTTYTIETKDSCRAVVDRSQDSVYSKENRPNEQEIEDQMSESDDAFNGNLSEAENHSSDSKNYFIPDVKRKSCQTFIDHEQAFASALSVVPEELSTVQTADDDVLKKAPKIIDSTNDTLPAGNEELDSTCGVPQGSTTSLIPTSKTDSDEQLVKTEEISKPAQDATDSVSIATKTPVKDGVYFKQLLNAQRAILAQFLSTFESILSDHERSKAASEELSCTDSFSTTSQHPCDTNSQNGAPANSISETSSAGKTPSISSDLEGHILLTVGQCKLLLNKKFPFFEKNCDKSLAQSQRAQPVDATEELQILNEDLSGLWDTMCIQIDEVREKFESLIRLRDNNWVPVHGSDSPDASTGNDMNGGKRCAIPKMNSLKASASAKRNSFGSDATKKSLARSAGSKSTSALPQLKSAKTEERKKFLEEKRKAMLAERRREMKKVNGGDGEGETVNEDATNGLVQFL